MGSGVYVTVSKGMFEQGLFMTRKWSSGYERQCVAAIVLGLKIHGVPAGT
jgi:hypothetical protein